MEKDQKKMLTSPDTLNLTISQWVFSSKTVSIRGSLNSLFCCCPSGENSDDKFEIWPKMSLSYRHSHLFSYVSSSLDEFLRTEEHGFGESSIAKKFKSLGSDIHETATTIR